MILLIKKQKSLLVPANRADSTTIFTAPAVQGIAAIVEEITTPTRTLSSRLVIETQIEFTTFLTTRVFHTAIENVVEKFA